MGRLGNMAIVAAVLTLFSCTRTETVSLIPPGMSAVRISAAGFGGTVLVPTGCEFDNLRVEIKGLDWQVVATARSETVRDVITLPLPAKLPGDKLCKVARNDYRDYTGFWPATGVSDREARVAELGDIVACKGDTAVGRLYLTDRAEKLGETRTSGHIVYFHYTDRPFTLSGLSTGKVASFIYEASFAPGWNPYAKIYYKPGDGRYAERTLVTTDLPPRASLRWRFERLP